MSDTDIHQLDTERQILFVLNENRAALSIEQINEQLISHNISPDSKGIKSFLTYTLRDARRRFIRDGLVYKTKYRYQIMQKGIEYLERTVMVIDPLSNKSTQETVGKILSGLSGDIKLCDPYFDDVAYALLKQNLNSQKLKSIEIIYSKNKIDPSKDYKIGNLSIRLQKKNKIHDRFLIDEKYLYILGTSLNNIGNKLSFIFNLTGYKDMFESIFGNYWNTS